MIGLAILGVAAIYCVIWAVAFKMVPTVGTKALVALVGAAIPTWDLPYGYFNFRQHCAIEEGVRISKENPHQGKSILVSYGFPFVETLLKAIHAQNVDVVQSDGRIVRYTKTSGTLGRDLLSQAAAPMEVPLLLQGSRQEGLPWHIHRYVLYVAIDRVRDQVIASSALISWRWGWIRDGLLKDLPGGQVFCDRERTLAESERFIVTLAQ